MTSFLFRKSQDNQKELKLLLDMYKSVSKEQRDKVQVGLFSPLRTNALHCLLLVFKGLK